MATIREALSAALQYQQAGKLEAAERIYRQILAIAPDQADAWHLLGVAALQAGKPSVAVEHISRAIALSGPEAAMQNSLGEAQRALSRLPEAIESYRRALELKPDYAEAQNNLGNALKDQGKLDEAIEHYRWALQLRPGYAEAHYNLGNVLEAQGKFDQAAACFRRAIELKPDYAEAHNNLGNVFRAEQKLAEAADCFRRAAAIRPDQAEPYNNLGNIFREEGHLDEAVACFRQALQRKPNLAKARCNLGNALAEQGQLEQAAECYRQVLQIEPNHPEAHNNLGSALEEMGDFAAAEASFRSASRADERFALAHYNLAALLGGKLPEPDLAAQLRLLNSGNLADAQRMLLHFGVAKVFDAHGQYADAATHLGQANALQMSEARKKGPAYDPGEFESLVSQMIAAGTPKFFERLRGFGSDSEVPVFVVGLPRSGTTLVEQILASHSHVFGAGEITLVQETMTALCGGSEDVAEALRRLDGQSVGKAATRHSERLRVLKPDSPRIVDKLPDNYLFLGPLAALFPRCKVIHCRRDLRDVALSCWMTYFRKIRWANDPRHIASRFQHYRRVMDHWRQVLPTPMLEVDYEELVADLEGVAHRLVAWCGLEWEPACLEFYRAKRPVRTASAVAVRQPVFSTSVGKWKHYERLLAPLFEGLTRQ